MKYLQVRRNDDRFHGTVVDIPERDWPMTSKLHPTWQVIEEVEESVPTMVVPDAPKPIGIECPICGFQAKSFQSLKIHRTRKHL